MEQKDIMRKKMVAQLCNGVPVTSATLLQDIGSSADNARWGEFVERYRGMMIAYLRTRFPSLEAEDIVQDTLMALSRIMPNYRYDPEMSGHFRNYLTGILRNKALRECEKRAREDKLRKKIAAFAPAHVADQDVKTEEWRKSVYEIAVRELLSDGSIHQRSKQIFLRLAVDGVPAEEVASSYGVSRNVVDKIKSRLIARLRDIASSLMDADEF